MSLLQLVSKQIETDQKMTKSKLCNVSKRFETFRNKLKQGFRKGENSRPYIFCFETLKHLDYIVNQLKQFETEPKMT